MAVPWAKQATLKLLNPHLITSTLIVQKRLLSKRPIRFVNTLLPEEAVPTDLIDISSLTTARVQLFCVRSLGFPLRYVWHHKNAPFPSSTKGLLYYHQPHTHAPLSACRIQFRLCDSPEGFASGRDLLLPNGTPWGISMWWIVSSGLGDDMVEKGMIDEKRLEHFTKVGPGLHPRAPSTLIWTLGQPFRFVLKPTKTSYAYICVAGEERLVYLRLNGLIELWRTLDYLVGGVDVDELVLSVYLDHDPENTRRPLVVRVAEEPPEPYNEWLKKHSPVPRVTVSGKASRRFGDQGVTSSLRDALKILISQKHGLEI